MPASRRPAAKPTEPVITKPLNAFGEALDAAEPRPSPKGTREDKKNYAERLSRACATVIANKLRPRFPGISPDEYGKRQEQRARTVKGYKKLDVNFSTPELGLGLGVSVKTLNFPDPVNGRYTKNFTRIDNELRAEADDYHQRQPYSVLIGVVYLPVESAGDATKRAASSFACAVPIFRNRNERPAADAGRAAHFERIFIGLYDPSSKEAVYFEVTQDPPRSGMPPSPELLTLDQLTDEIHKAFRRRNP